MVSNMVKKDKVSNIIIDWNDAKRDSVVVLGVESLEIIKDTVKITLKRKPFNEVLMLRLEDVKRVSKVDDTYQLIEVLFEVFLC